MNEKVKTASKNAKKNLKTSASFIGQHYKTILAGLFGLFILYWIMFVLTPKMNMSVQEKATIDSLNNLIIEMHKSQQILDDKIDGIKEEINEVDKDIDKINRQKTIVKEIYHEKITRASNFTEPELDSFFTDRYKQ